MPARQATNPPRGFAGSMVPAGSPRDASVAAHATAALCSSRRPAATISFSSGQGRYFAVAKLGQVDLHHGQATRPASIMSASASGPIGWLQPSFMPASMFRRGQSFRQHKNASLIMGTRMRLTTKPGAFFDGDRGLPRASASAFDGVVRGVTGLKTLDDFHQGHHWHGAEEVHSDEAVCARRSPPAG